MSGRLLRRKIINVCEAEFDKLDRWGWTKPHAVLCEIEFRYFYPDDYNLDGGDGWMFITVDDYLNLWYQEDVRRVLSYLRTSRRRGASWTVKGAAHHPMNGA